MSKNMIKNVSLKLALMTAAIAIMLMICCCAVYASEDSVLPEKVNGRYEIYNRTQLEAYLYAANGRQRTISGQTMQADANASCIFMRDIDYENYQWVQLGANSGNPFSGTIDGNGHTLSNYQFPYTYNGLIVYNSGIVKDITVDAGTKTIADYTNPSTLGVIAMNNEESGIISGVTVRGDLTYTASSATGGAMICGQNKGIIRCCVTEGKFTNYYGATSITRANAQTGLIEYCYNRATIISITNSPAYGLVKSNFDYNMGTIRNCYNCGKLYKNGENGDETYDLSNATGLINCYASNEEFTAADLGGEFVDDLEGADAVNNGYPVFPFQIGGAYPHVEGAYDLVVKDITYIDDTSIILTAENKFDYYTLRSKDFTLKVVSGDRTAEIPVTDISQGGKNRISLTFDSIVDAKDAKGDPLRSAYAQELTVKILAAGEEVAETVYEIGPSRYWSDYAKEPVKVEKTDKKYGEKFSGYYMITCPEELAWVAKTLWNSTSNSLRDKFFLAEDIYLNDTSVSEWEDSDEKMIWDTPIGEYGNTPKQFTGVFDGNGHKIAGVIVDSHMKSRTHALFGMMSGTLKNLKVEDAIVEGTEYVGGIVAYGTQGEISNCRFDGKVTGGTYTGGIVGFDSQQKFFIANCVNKGTILGNNQNQCGGIAGYLGSSDVESCYNTGKVTGAGIAGYTITTTKISNCYNAGNVTYSINSSANATLSNIYVLSGKGRNTGKVDVLSDTEFKDGTLLEYLTADTDAPYYADGDMINNGYPVLSWESPLLYAQAEYPAELDLYVDLDDYAMNRDEIQAIIDEAKEKIVNAESAAESDAAFAEAKAAIDAIPSDKQIKEEEDAEIARLKEEKELAAKTLAFDMCLISIDNDSFVYSGEAFEPVVTAMTIDGTALVKGTDYEVRYEANVEPGFGKVIVSGKEAYAGDREIKFTIAPAKVSGLKLKKAKKAFTAKWTSDEKVTGYQVSYGLKKNFKGAKTVKITKNSTVSKKVTKLKANKKYFVRVRAYVTSGDQTIYGAWSPVKSVKTK